MGSFGNSCWMGLKRGAGKRQMVGGSASGAPPGVRGSMGRGWSPKSGVRGKRVVWLRLVGLGGGISAFDPWFLGPVDAIHYNDIDGHFGRDQLEGESVGEDGRMEAAAGQNTLLATDEHR